MAYNSFSMTVTVRSFAKINLGLYIGAARADGYHTLRTVYQTIALHDLIRVRVGRGRGIEIACNDPRVPLDASNTCYRMAERVLEALGAKARVSIEIEKRLPVQGGLGAASSNAVATMMALERAMAGTGPFGSAQGRLRPVTTRKRKLSAEARLRIAAEVGSDLPLFLVGGTVLGVGRGEEVYPLPDLPSMAMVVVTPEVGVSTPQAFADWDALVQGEKAAELRSAGTGEGARPHTNSGAELCSAGQVRAPAPTRTRTGGDARRSTNREQLTAGGASDRLVEVGCALPAWLSVYPNTGASAKGGSRAESLLSGLVRTGIENDFERVVIPQYPELRDIKGALERAGASYASLSGSGSALYGLFRSAGEAAKAASRLRKQGVRAEATRTLTRQKYWKSLVVGR
jgi:4-diphosphocytidyl-2-C-methyl-D-erythritol kinase